MQHIRFDFNNLFEFNIGAKHGVSLKDIKTLANKIKKGQEHLQRVIKEPASRLNVDLEWVTLPHQDEKTINAIQVLGRKIAESYENVVFLGIGGSYLGLKAAQDALSSPYYNEFKSVRMERPKVYFEGNNIDPAPLKVLLNNLDSKKTAVIVISKSGQTIETKASFQVVETWLKRGVGAKFGHQIFAVTDPVSGDLRRRVNEEQSKDKKSFRNLPLLKGIGGRYSEFNMGLLHLAIIGIVIQDVLDGAKAMAGRCKVNSIYKNPALMYAALQYILYTKKSKTISVLMPFSERLKSTSDWYAQLLAESLGKKYQRKIKIDPSGYETWDKDLSRIVNVGRTPVICRGTTDLHSIQQNNVEGENNKTVTFIRTEDFKDDLKIVGVKDFLYGKSFGQLLNLAQEATEWSLTLNKRPNCTIIMPQVCGFNWGELLFFFQMATAFEGELLNVNAFDQPGVESYKNYMYAKLKKPGISVNIKEEIKNKRLIKRKEFIL
ncbi:MAG: hypothetical protein AB1629_03885 [Candidatus Omnitrophota bacterium]